MESLFLHHIEFFRSEIYVLLFLGLLLEGEIILFAAFFLVPQGRLDFFDIVYIALAGVLVGDIVWYFTGPAILNLPFFQRTVRKVSRRYDAFLYKRWALSIIATKFIYGFHRITLLHLRIAGVKFGQFLKADIPGALLWIAAVAVASEIFSNSWLLLKRYVHYWEIGFTLSLILFVGITKAASQLLARKVLPADAEPRNDNSSPSK